MSSSINWLSTPIREATEGCPGIVIMCPGLSSRSCPSFYFIFFKQYFPTWSCRSLGRWDFCLPAWPWSPPFSSWLPPRGWKEKNATWWAKVESKPRSQVRSGLTWRLHPGPGWTTSSSRRRSPRRICTRGSSSATLKSEKSEIQGFFCFLYFIWAWVLSTTWKWFELDHFLKWVRPKIWMI